MDEIQTENNKLKNLPSKVETVKFFCVMQLSHKRIRKETIISRGTLIKQPRSNQRVCVTIFLRWQLVENGQNGTAEGRQHYKVGS